MKGRVMNVVFNCNALADEEGKVEELIALCLKNADK